MVREITSGTAFAILKSHKVEPFIAQKVQARDENDPVQKKTISQKIEKAFNCIPWDLIRTTPGKREINSKLKNVLEI